MKFAAAFVLGVLVGAAGWYAWTLPRPPTPAAIPVAHEPTSEQIVEVPDDQERALAAFVSGDLLLAGGLANAALDLDPRASWALTLRADIAEKGGDRRSAINYLLEILDYPDDLDLVEPTSARLELLIAAFVQRQVEGHQTAAVVELYRDLVQRFPANDRYRFELARWMTVKGDFDGADYIAGTIGHGVDDSRVEALQRQIDARSPLPLREAEKLPFPALVSEHRIVAQVSMGGRELSLLVDTGATITAINESVLARIDAAKELRTLTIATAAGPTQADVYLVNTVAVGQLRMGELRVIGLRAELDDVDGLLGMDVLRRTRLLPTRGRQ